jgi:hypothetical protein
MSAQFLAEQPFVPDEPEPLVREIPRGAPYPAHALGPLQAAVKEVHGITQAPIAICAQSALAVASLAVQGFADVETLGGTRPLSLFLLTIARSGERKTSCDQLFMEALREHERKQAKRYREDRQDWQRRHAIWRARHDRILADVKRAKGGDSAAAQAQLRALGPEPEAPPLPDRIVTEPTFEGLAKLFAQGQPSLGLFSDEGGLFLGGHAMNKDNRQKTLAALNDLWQGNPIRRTRAGDGHVTLFGRRLAMHLMIQPMVARALIADPLAADTGFLARFLICEPPSTIGTRLHAKTRHERAALDRFGERLRDILETTMPIDPQTRALAPRRLPLSNAAREALVRFADGVERAQAPGGDLERVTGAASKAAEQAARIAGVLTLWRDLAAVEVEPGDMANAIELARFHLLEAARLADAAQVSTAIAEAEKLRRWLLEGFEDTVVSVRDVVRKGPGSLRESPKARAALELLEQHGWLVRLVVQGRERSARWRIMGKPSRKI